MRKKILFLILFLLLSNPCFSQTQDFVDFVNGLSSDGSPGTDTELYGVDDPSGTPTSKKSTIGQVLVDSNIPNDLTINSTSDITTTGDINSDGTIYANNGFFGDGSNLSGVIVNPGGINTQIQFNDSGSFGGDSGLTYNKTTDSLSVFGDFDIQGTIFDSSDEFVTVGEDMEINGTLIATFYYGNGSNLSGISINPGGSDTQVQFNDGGSFGGDSGLVYNKTTDFLDIGGDISVSGTINVESTLQSTFSGLVVIKGTGSTIEFSVGETSDPCGNLQEGTIFYNDTSNYFCYCDGTNDVQIHNPSTACF